MASNGDADNAANAAGGDSGAPIDPRPSGRGERLAWVLGSLAVLLIVVLIGVIVVLLMSDDEEDDKAVARKEGTPTVTVETTGTTAAGSTTSALAPSAGQAATPTTPRPSTSATPATSTTAPPPPTAPPTDALPRFTSVSATPPADFICSPGDTVTLRVSFTAVNTTRVNAAGFGGGTQDSGPSGSYGATMPCSSSINQITVTLTAYGPEGATVRRVNWHAAIQGGTK